MRYAALRSPVRHFHRGVDLFFQKNRRKNAAQTKTAPRGACRQPPHRAELCQAPRAAAWGLCASVCCRSSSTVPAGAAREFLASATYGLLQLIFDGAYAWGPTSMLVDYVLAFGVLGVACLFRKQKGGVFVGTVVGCVCRFIVHFISGVTIYRIYEPRSLIRPSPTPISIPPSTTAAMCSLTWCSASSSPRCSTARYPAILRRGSGRHSKERIGAGSKKRRDPSPPTDCQENRSKRNGSPAGTFQLHRCADGAGDGVDLRHILDILGVEIRLCEVAAHGEHAMVCERAAHASLKRRNCVQPDLLCAGRRVIRTESR